jgi:signal transduction histidine kinase
MYESPNRLQTERQPADECKQLSITPVPKIGRSISTGFGRRHVKGVAIVRYLVAIWLTLLGSVLCALGQFWGALFFPTAGAVGAVAYLMPRWVRALETEKLETEKNVLRVRDLERSRAHAVDDAAARLRRIEQDLHDGAQAQMVAVVMKLGLARQHLGSRINGSGQPNPERALELVDAAHRGALEAIAELRDLARGIHPPALDEGLGPALAALPARSNLPVELIVDLAERPSAAIETIAYFCAAELLTNVAKYSAARHVTLEASHRPGLVTIRVSDDGTGGARIVPGGGLAGLAERVKTVDGKLEVNSPPGGGTVVTVELPSHA